MYIVAFDDFRKEAKSRALLLGSQFAQQWKQSASLCNSKSTQISGLSGMTAHPAI